MCKNNSKKQGGNRQTRNDSAEHRTTYEIKNRPAGRTTTSQTGTNPPPKK